MADYRVPFATVSPDAEPSRFDPGPLLARIVAEGLLKEGPKGTVEGTVSTPWGDLEAERRSADEVLIDTPTAEVSQRQVLMTVAATKLGVEKATIERSHGTIQEIDVGERVLVCPYPTADGVRNAPDEADPSGVPAVDATAGIAYAVTQESPYVKIFGRLWGDARPLTALAAAGVHLVGSKGFRPTYPRTRIVGSLVNHGEESCEITVQAHQAGDGPAIERVLVGGTVRPVEE